MINDDTTSFHSSIHPFTPKTFSHKQKDKKILVQKFEIVALNEILRHVREPHQDDEPLVLLLVVVKDDVVGVVEQVRQVVGVVKGERCLCDWLASYFLR